VSGIFLQNIDIKRAQNQEDKSVASLGNCCPDKKMFFQILKTVIF
jgi:hypothetical protein